MSDPVYDSYVLLASLTANGEPARDAYESLAAIREQVMADVRLSEDNAMDLLVRLAALMGMADARKWLRSTRRSFRAVASGNLRLHT